MQKLFKANTKYFFYVYLAFLLLGSLLIVFVPYGNISIAMNKIANPLLDTFALVLTQFGLGVVMGLLVLVFLFIRYYYALATLISLIFTGIFTGLFKKILFKGMPRPTQYFGKDSYTHLIPGFDYHELNTFPSGHAMTAFALVLLIALAINNKTASYVLASFGILVALTRVYLLQHFFLDIYVGSAFGIVCTLLGLYLAQGILKKDETLMQRSLRDLPFFKK